MHFLENGVLSGESLGAYIRGELNFQSNAQIYKKTVIIREKKWYKLFGEKSV